MFLSRFLFRKTLWLGAVLFAAAELAQAGTTGRLEGTVRDAASREPLVGAMVAIVQTHQGTVTDSDGKFIIHNLRAGTYEVKVSMLGYQFVLYKDVVVQPDLRTKLTIALRSIVIEMEGVEVAAERPLIQTDVTGSTWDRSAEHLETIPYQKFQSVVGLQPGVTAEGNIRGGKTREVIYLVDGFPIQDVVSGGLGMELPKSAIAQLSVKSGGFEAEYGNALSGVVNIITGSGGRESHLQARMDKDNLLGGTQVSKTSTIDVLASGPLAKDKISYLFTSTVLLTDTRWWQDMKYFFTSPVQQEIYGFGKVDWLCSSDKRLSGQMLFSQNRRHEYEFSWRYNLAGLPPWRRDSYRAALFWTQTINSRLFYTVSLCQNDFRTRIGGNDERSLLSAAPYQYDFYLLYVVDGSRLWWADMRQNTTTAKAEITSQWKSSHIFKSGFEFKRYDINSSIRKLEPQLSYFGKPLLDKDLLNYSNRYHYYPYGGSFYLQDKYESSASRSVISAGVRFDFLDPRAQRPAVELIPKGADEYLEQVKAFVPARIKYQISPRIGFAFPFTDKSYFFINWGRYIQFPLFEQLYAGLGNVELANGIQVLRGNPELLAEKTTALEISARYNFAENLVASALYFHKETTDQIDSKTLVSPNSRISGDYGFAEYVNNPYATAQGFEFVLNREKGEVCTGTLSYTLMFAKGLSEYENQGLNMAQWGFPIANSPYYLSWDQRHTVTADLLFRLPRRIKLNLVWQFHSGRPYTYYPSLDGFSPLREGMVFLPNNRRMPKYQNADIYLGKIWNLGRTLLSHHQTRRQIELYLQIRNMFNDRNIRWIDASGRIGGELNDPSAYDIGRRSVVGLRSEL